MTKVGRALRIFRDARELSLGELARNAQISTAYLSLIESGNRNPSLDVLDRLSSALRLPTDLLISISQPGEGSLVSTRNELGEVVNAVRKLELAESKLRERLGEIEDREIKSDRT